MGSSGSEQLARDIVIVAANPSAPVAVATSRSQARPHRPAARARALTDRPAAGAAITLVASVGFVVLRLFVAGHGQVSRLVMAERPFADPALVPPGLAVLPKNGYDGQFFYRLALNPSNLHNSAYRITFDATLRVQRIGYPVLAWSVSYGRHPWVPVALVVVTLPPPDRHWLAGRSLRPPGPSSCSVEATAGRLLRLRAQPRSRRRRTVAAACWLAGLLAYRRRHPALAGLLLAYSALTREAVMVVVAPSR